MRALIGLVLLASVAHAQEPEPDLRLVVTRGRASLTWVGQGNAAQVESARVHLRVGPPGSLAQQPFKTYVAKPGNAGAWNVELRHLSTEENVSAEFYGEATIRDLDGARVVRSPAQVWELYRRKPRPPLQSIVPEFAPPFDQRKGEADPEVAKRVLAHVRAGQRYHYSVVYRGHASTLIDRVRKVDGGDVHLSTKFVNEVLRGGRWREQVWRAPGALLERFPPKPKARATVPGLGEIECLVFEIRGVEIWSAAVDGKPTYPWLVKVASSTTKAQLIRVEPDWR